MFYDFWIRAYESTFESCKPKRILFFAYLIFPRNKKINKMLEYLFECINCSAISHFPFRQRSAAESGSSKVNQKLYRKEKLPLCFESKRSIILRHNPTARAHNERGLQKMCTDIEVTSWLVSADDFSPRVARGAELTRSLRSLVRSRLSQLVKKNRTNEPTMK